MNSTGESGPNIVEDDLAFHIDAINRKSYISGSTTANTLTPTSFGKDDLSWVGPLNYATDIY